MIHEFADLFTRLDRTTSTLAKIDAMATYFSAAEPADGAWAVFFLSGGRFKRFVGARRLAEWTRERAGIPEWLLDACYEATGDLAETAALLVDEADAQRGAPAPEPLHAFVQERILALDELGDERSQLDAIGAILEGRRGAERFVIAKMLTGALRVGVSKTLVVRALARASGVERNLIQHRLTGAWDPSPEAFEALIAEGEGAGEDASQPYPFFLASPLDVDPSELGALEDFAFEWKWDGIRSQLIRRAGQTFLWSRGEERIEAQFPEIAAIGAALPDGAVVDGEILVWDFDADAPAPFALLQKRIGRKKPGKKILADAPALLMAYDLLEDGGEDLRAAAYDQRRARLLEIVTAAAQPILRASPTVAAPSLDALRALRASSRERRVEGFMIKRRSSPYRTGRKKGDWWKWKVDPLTLDCVLVYAQAGHGKRAGLFTDYSFAVRDDRADGTGELATVAKAYSGLDHAELEELDKWIRKNTVERFGPVRSVRPEHVFEIGFEHVRLSKRHKSGVAVRFPRILRWRRDKKPEDADALSTLMRLAESLA